jgi:hypothetical protein
MPKKPNLEKERWAQLLLAENLTFKEIQVELKNRFNSTLRTNRLVELNQEVQKEKNVDRLKREIRAGMDDDTKMKMYENLRRNIFDELISLRKQIHDMYAFLQTRVQVEIEKVMRKIKVEPSESEFINFYQTARAKVMNFMMKNGVKQDRAQIATGSGFNPTIIEIILNDLYIDKLIEMEEQGEQRLFWYKME